MTDLMLKDEVYAIVGPTRAVAWLKSTSPTSYASGQVVVELKAIEELSGKDEAQALNYLKATGLRGCLVLTSAAMGNWSGNDSSDDLPSCPSCPSWTAC